MVDPWFDPIHFGTYFGAIGGSAVGLLGGILGTLTGVLAPKGKGRVPVIAAWIVSMALGVATLAVGIVAVVSGQPYGIWYPLVLLGAILGGITTMLLFLVVLPAYRAVEARKLAAEEIRRV